MPCLRRRPSLSERRYRAAIAVARRSDAIHRKQSFNRLLAKRDALSPHALHVAKAPRDPGHVRRGFCCADSTKHGSYDTGNGIARSRSGALDFPQMNADEIRQALREMPPGSFTVHLQELTQLEVLHTDFAMLSPTGRTLTAYEAERHLHHINTDAITRISHQLPAERAGD